METQSYDFCLSPSRRSFLKAGASLAVAVGTLSGISLQASPPAKRLMRPTQLQQLDTRSKIVIELDGKLHLKPHKPDRDAKPREAEVKAKSTLDYFEKVAFQEDRMMVAARRYVEAHSENWIEGKAAELKLRPECHETRLMQHDGTWQQFCQTQPLDLRETQLLQSPVNSGSLELLLPKEAATAKSKWNFENEDLQELFNLDAVYKNTLKAQVAKVEKGVATIQLQGTIDGTANAVPTKIKVDGNYRVQFGSQCPIVTWLGLSVQEDREIGEAEPGFSVTARVRLIRMETKEQFSASAEDLRTLAKADDPGRWLVRIQSPSGGFSMLGDRRWRTFVDSREETILRFIEKNTVIAQCNISRLTSLQPGKQVTLEGMQADIKRSLGEKFEEFLEAKEQVTSNDLRLMRSVASGMVEEVPVQWIYNHLSNDEGERIALIYTLGGNMVEQFAGNDVQMASSFEILEPAAGTSPDVTVQKNAAKEPAPTR